MPNFYEKNNPKINAKLGFSLIQLLILIAIISLISLISIRLTEISNAYLVKLELEKLYSYCTFLQRCAVINKTKQKLKFNKLNNSYFVHKREIKLNSKVKFGILDNAPTPTIRDKDKFVKQSISFVNDKIDFFPEGNASAGVVYITDNKKKYLYALSNGVGHFSYFRCYEYKMGKWQALK